MRVLVYGDSNSWGVLADGLGNRHPRRWPVVLAEAAGVELIEDCVPGRTTVFDDPEMAEMTGAPADAFNGLAHLPASLLGAAPVDLVLIMLGTNDMKTRFSPSAERIADNLARLVACIRALPFGDGPWSEAPPPAVGVICPAALGDLADDPSWERAQEWQGGSDAALALFDALEMSLGGAVPVFNAGTVVSGSTRDPIHFEPEMHELLGKAVADWLRVRFPYAKSRRALVDVANLVRPIPFHPAQ